MNYKVKFAITTIVSVIFAFAIFLLVLMISNKNVHQFDLTANKRFSLSVQSVQVVEKLADPVEALVFKSQEDQQGRKQAMNLLNNYTRANSAKFSYRLIDPKRSPLEAKKYDIVQPGPCVLVCKDKSQRVSGVDEEELTNALLALTDSVNKKAYFLMGHGEMNAKEKTPQSLDQYQVAMAKEGIISSELNLIEAKKVPDDAAVVVIAAPKTAFLDNEKDILTKWLFDGGKIFVTMELETGDKLDWLLEKCAIKSTDEVILDQAAQAYGTEPIVAVGSAYNPDSPIVEHFTSFTLFKLARPVEVVEGKVPTNATVVPVVATSQYAFTLPGQDVLNKAKIEVAEKNIVRTGSLNLAVSGIYPKNAPKAKNPTELPDSKDPKASNKDNGPQGRIVVVGDGAFISNELFNLGANRDLAMNILNWLTLSDNRITVRPKDATKEPVMISPKQNQVIKFVLILGVPIAVFLAGISNARRRKQ